MRILIAEDDQVLADGLLRTLLSAGAAVDHVASGTAADAALMTNTEFDLLILDLGLPRMHGLEVLKRLPPKSDGLKLQLSLGMLFLLVSGAQALLPEAGLPAAVSAGVVVGLRLDAEASQLDELVSQLAQLAITVLFPLLAADLSWGELSPLGWGGVACVLALMVFRWIVIQVGGIGLPSLGWRDKLMLSWIAPRGIVTAAVASLFAIHFQEAGIPGAGA